MHACVKSCSGNFLVSVTKMISLVAWGNLGFFCREVSLQLGAWTFWKTEVWKCQMEENLMEKDKSKTPQLPKLGRMEGRKKEDIRGLWPVPAFSSSARGQVLGWLDGYINSRWYIPGRNFWYKLPLKFSITFEAQNEARRPSLHKILKN